MSPVWWFLAGAATAMTPLLFALALIVCRSLEKRPCVRNHKTR